MKLQDNWKEKYKVKAEHRKAETNGLLIFECSFKATHNSEELKFKHSTLVVEKMMGTDVDTALDAWTKHCVKKSLKKLG